MCLHVVTEEFDKPISKVNYGWKVFVNEGDGTLGGPYYGQGYKYNRWIHDERYNMLFCDYQWYETGFHLFKTRADARLYSKELIVAGTFIRKVKYKNVVAQGFQYFYVINSGSHLLQALDIIVAKSMLILRDKI